MFLEGLIDLNLFNLLEWLDFEIFRLGVEVRKRSGVESIGPRSVLESAHCIGIRGILRIVVLRNLLDLCCVEGTVVVII